MTSECYEKLGFHFLPTALVTNDDVPKNVAGVDRVKTKSALKESINILMEVMNLLIYVLVFAAVLLAAVVIYNLGVLSFTERQRELSTLKVIGFKTGKLRSLLLMQNIWLTFAGIILGIPVGIWILNYICTFLGDAFDFMITINIATYLICILGTLLVSSLVNRLFSKRVRNIDMVSSLKGVE
jgi:putative ABC transport system permease protein